MKVQYVKFNEKLIEKKNHLDNSPKSGYLNPYINLGYSDYSAIHTESVYFMAQELMKNPNESLAPHQLNTSSNLRRDIQSELNLKNIALKHPSELEPSLRSPAWDYLCSLLENWAYLSEVKKDNCIFLLCRLGFFELVNQLEESFTNQELRESEVKCRTLARYTNARHKTGVKYDSIKTLERIVEFSQKGTSIRLATINNIIVHYAKNKDLKNLFKWEKYFKDEYESFDCSVVSYKFLYQSMYYRALSYVPFSKGDMSTAYEYLNLALNKSSQIITESSNDDHVAEMLFKENHHPLLETYSRVDLLNDKKNEAINRMKQLIAHDYYDPKVHHTLGDIYFSEKDFESGLRCYKTALSLGAPYIAMSHYKMGICYEKLGEINNALISYMLSYETDRLSISSLLKMQSLAKKSGSTLILQESTNQLNSLKIK